MRRSIEFPPFRKLSFGRASLPLPRPRCSLQSECCGFKAPGPRSTAHPHICPLSTQPVPSGDIYSSLGDTLLSAAEENGAEGEGAEHKPRCVPGGWVTSSHQLCDALFIATPLIWRPAPLSLLGIPGLGHPINQAGPLGSARGARVLPAGGLWLSPVQWNRLVWRLVLWEIGWFVTKLLPPLFDKLKYLLLIVRECHIYYPVSGIA